MGDDADRHLSLLERLDLALAMRAARDVHQLEDDQLEESSHWVPPWQLAGPREDGLWVARTLALRGLFVDPIEAKDILEGGNGRYSAPHHELLLVRGMARVLEAIRERVAAGKLPDGWFAVELFRKLTAGIARFHNNALRRDEPWDSIPGVDYPESDSIPDRLDEFRPGLRYAEAASFDDLHPVRRAPRLLWRFARMSPFPDMNLVMGFVLFNAYLAGHGYPFITAESEDRALFTQLVRGTPPKRVVQLESRLVQECEGLVEH